LCNIIAISGDSGSGKSTLLSILLPLFDDTNLLKFETDRYHKWERGDKNYDLYTHLNPYANYLEKMSEDVYNLKIGNEIYAVNYNHANGKFTNEEVIESKTNIILCGLHTLSNKINFYTDIKIFLDTDRNLIKKWKIKRDHYERKYPINKILQQIERREEDYKLYIETQKINADINIKYYEKEDKLHCIIEILNEMIINKILKYLVNLKYSITYNKNLKIELFGNIEHINLEILKNNYNYDKKIDNDLNGELQFLFILILYNCMY
jgi:uridine kinase